MQSVNQIANDPESPYENCSNQLIRSMERNHSVAIVGDNPEALLLSVLYAEAGIPNFLVGPFGDDGRTHANRPGIEEALWLLGIFKKSEKIKIIPDHHQLPLSQVKTLILAAHASGPDHTNDLEMTFRNLAPGLAPGTSIAFTGLCKPHYTSSVMKSTIEKHGGLKIGVDLNLYYIPLLWAGEGLREFREKRKVLAGFESADSSTFQEELLRVFPTLSVTPTVELAEASGLFSAISQEVARGLELELAKMSERHGINYDEVRELCRDTRVALTGGSNPIAGRESIATGIALSSSPRRNGPRLVRAAHSINGEYQSQILDMIRRALNHCGYPLRRSRVAILGADGLLKNSWSKPESPQIIESLRKRGAQVSLYPGENGSQPWAGMVGDHARVESSLLRAVAKANCTIVALPKSFALELDADQLATQMNRPGAICDLTRVLEASNVERAGLFYTTIGRGTPDT
jgi:UDP-N-acetyl-D-mannosaminuronate dehydrogenase